MAIGDIKKCDFCGREGKVVMSEMLSYPNSKEKELFEFSMCPWHKGWETRRKLWTKKQLTNE